VTEWVTATQAVGLLNVSERSVRRFVRQLPDTDRRKRQGSPLEFRLSALTELMGRTGGVPDTDRQAPEATTGEGRRAPDNRSSAPDTAGQSESALVEQLRGEVEYLRSALSASQQIASQAQQLQLLAERRLAEVEGKVLPAKGDTESPEVQQSPPDAPDTKEPERLTFMARMARWFA